ncbi:MAG: hypothetical protein WBD09_11380 [Halobacteriota archaeon]
MTMPAKKKKKKKCLFTAEPAESRKNLLSRLRALRALGGKRMQNFRRDENAVSAVIGFVLIIGILISASSIYFASQVPEWTKDFEALHTADVADDLSELKTRIDGIKGELFERTTHVKMSPDNVPILGISPPGSNLIIDPEDEKFEVIVPVGGGGGGSGNWTIPNSGFTYYYDTDNSNRVSVSDDEVMLSSPTTENLILPDGTEKEKELTGDLFYPYIHYYDQVVIKNNSVLSVASGTGVLRIHASSITIDNSSKIDIDGRGNPAGSGTGPGGAGSSYSKGPKDYAGGGGGAGYGGEGGDGGGGSYGGSGGTKYGDDESVFVQMGSGGGAGGEYGGATGGAGGAGGGGIWLDAEEITIEGTISANGADGGDGSDGLAGGGGGGSGGGILIRGKEVTISGTLSANGGDGGNGYADGDGGGGGGGGRIKIFYELDSDIPDGSVAGGQRGSGSPPPGSGAGGFYHDGYPKAYVTSPTDVTYYSSGYFVSTVHDTGNDSVCYGEMTWDATLNGQDLVMKVRTDWNESMAYATHWHDCPELESDDGENEIDLAGVGSVSPVAHRYVQYRAELSTDDDSKTPALTRTKVNYSFATQSPVLANASGSIKFKSNYLHYPNQEIVYEHGAVIKYQREGGFMLQRPPIIISNKSGIPAIKISLVDLTGANYSYSGSITMSVKNRFKSYELLADCLNYPDLTINVTTEYPSVWGDWFNNTFAEESELDGSYYDVSVTANNVEVKFYGKGDGVELYLERTAVEVEI